MESITTTESHLFELQVDHNGSAYLKETAKWAKFMSIMGFIFCGLFVLVALFAGTFLSAAFSSFGAAGSAMGGAMVSVLYIAIALIYFFPCLYLFNFATKMQTALRNNDQELMNVSFKNLKSCYRFMGILMIIGLGFWALGIIAVVLGGTMRG
jgi:hypothetical protein